MKNIIFILLVCLTFSSCKKEKAVHITATNVATGQRLAGLHYYVVELSTTANGEKSKTVREGDLDENGEANFNLKIRKKAHVIRVVEPDNYCYRENISITLGSDEDFFADFKFAPCGYVKINFNNVNCEGPNDVMNYKRKYSYSEWLSNNQYYSGCYSYLSPMYGEIPSGQIIHEVRVVRSGVTSYVYDTTFLSAGEYKTINLNY